MNLSVPVSPPLSLTKGFPLSFIEQYRKHHLGGGRDEGYFTEIFYTVL